jgi:hypothetical protein
MQVWRKDGTQHDGGYKQAASVAALLFAILLCTKHSWYGRWHARIAHVGKREIKRPLGSPKNRREDNSKTDHWETWCKGADSVGTEWGLLMMCFRVS